MVSLDSSSPFRTRPIFITGGGGLDNDELNDSENSGRWADEEGQLYEKTAGLSPVSEYPNLEDEEMDDDDALTIYNVMEAGVPQVPDGGWGWVVVFASFMCNMILDGITNVFGVFLPQYTEAFNEGKGKVSLVGSILPGVLLVMGPIVSALTNKFGCRSVAIVGAIIGAIGFALSSLSPNISVLMLTYGVIGGIGFGMVYLPTVVCVGYYFESKRALATGIAVCGSGVGTFVFAPLGSWLLTVSDWKVANLIWAGLIFCCAIFALLMRPLEVRKEAYYDEEEEYDEEDKQGEIKTKPLLQRMYEEKRNYMEKGSICGSQYFMVQLPDGTMERRQKLPLNIDPGVHSSFNLDQLVPGSPITPVPTVLALPTITEAKVVEGSDGSREGSSGREGTAENTDEKEEKTEKKENSEDDESNSNIILQKIVTPTIGIPDLKERIEDIKERIEEEKIEEEKTDEEKSDEGNSRSDDDDKKDSKKDALDTQDGEDESILSSSAMSNSRRIPRIRRNSDGVYSTPSNTPPSNSLKISEFMGGKSPSRPIPVKGVAIPNNKIIHGSIPRNGSAPQFTPGRPIPKNTSVPLFDRMHRKHSITYKAVPSGTPFMTRNNSGGTKSALSESRRGSANQFKNSLASFISSKNYGNNQQEEDYNSLWSKGELNEGLIFSTSKRNSQSSESRQIIRPLSRKDIFYSGSIINLPEYQSQKSINSYRQSILNIPIATGGYKATGPGGGLLQDSGDGEGGDINSYKKPLICPSFFSRAGAFKTTLSQMMDFSLLKNPVFLFIAFSNIFAMLGFYVPFVYLIDSALNKGVDKDNAAYLLSIIGVTNTIGRVITGLISDSPRVNSLLMNNICLLLTGISVASVPLCDDFTSYIVVALFFGLFAAGYVSLTSIILVELLGLDNLTNAFGLLLLFRGFASFIGSPLAGVVYDTFQTYDIPFYLAGGFFIVSSLISFIIPFIGRFAPEKPLLEPRVSFGGYLEDIPEVVESSLEAHEKEMENDTEKPEIKEKEKEKCEQVESCL